MYLEERVGLMEKEVEGLKEKILSQTAKSDDRFVSPMELAEIMGCSRTTISNKIKSGEIYATRKLGDPRIPMSQFYKSEPIDLLKRRPGNLKRASGTESLKDLVFGEEHNAG